MHLADSAQGIMGTSAVVATTIPNAVGYALAQQYRRSGLVTAVFFGDGATEEGVFWESVNFAALKQVPVLFICENNRYAIHSHQAARQAGDNLVERVRSFGLIGERLGDDVLALRQRAALAIESLRHRQAKPVMLECMTYRWREHVGPQEDFHLGYRSREEAEVWMRGDQVQRIGALLLSSERKEIERDVEEEILKAFEYAANSPFPASDELPLHVFKS